VNIDPSLRSHRPNPVRMLPAPCTLLFGNGPQVRLMFRLCFDKDQGSKIRNVTMAKAWFMNCNKFALTVVLHPSWGFQLRSLIIHEVSLRRFHVYIIPTNQQGRLGEHNTQHLVTLININERGLHHSWIRTCDGIIFYWLWNQMGATLLYDVTRLRLW